jgi:sulfite reductase alpha subunit-like flavoprotein
MSKLNQGDVIDFDITKGTLSLLKKHVPVICIGPGPGVAPMRSILYHQFKTTKCDSLLVFGSRSKDMDFFYEKEWEIASKLYPFQLITAFSRDQEDKIYVQHRMKEHGKRILELICQKDAVIYISGNAKRMPVDVKEAFMFICQQYGDMTEKDAIEFMIKLQKEGRYQEECWS